MGCPKHFSIQGGMGCGLLKNRQKIKEVKNVDWIDDKQIMTTLCSNLQKPVTCKIRLLDTEQDTIDVVKTVSIL